MALSFSEVQTVTALSDPSTLWTPDELQVYQQLFRMTLPHKNQSVQTYWECWGCGAVKRGNVIGLFVYRFVCGLVQCVMNCGEEKKLRSFQKVFWCFLSYCHSSTQSCHFQAAFSSDPQSPGWTSGLNSMESSPTNQPNTYKPIAVCISVFELPLLISHFHPHTVHTQPSKENSWRSIRHVM